MQPDTVHRLAAAVDNERRPSRWTGKQAALNHPSNWRSPSFARHGWFLLLFEDGIYDGRFKNIIVLG